MANLAIVAWSPAFGQDFEPGQKQAVLDGVARVLDEMAFVPGVDFSDWDVRVEKDMARLREARSSSEFSRAVNRILATYGVSHLRLQAPRRQGFGNTSGLGMVVSLEDDGFEVAEVLPGGPADRSGIAPGDVIVRVDGERPMTRTSLSARSGQEPRLLVRSPNGKTREVTIRVPQSERARASLTWMEDSVAVLAVPTFGQGYDRQAMELHLAEVMSGSAKGLILDLRSNAGGFGQNMSHALSLFMDPWTVYGSTVGKVEYLHFKRMERREPASLAEVAAVAKAGLQTVRLRVVPFKGPLAVVIDRDSISAAEIVAQCLKEQRQAVIVGQPSRGAVLGSRFERLPFAFRLHYPAHDFVTAAGTRIEGNAIVPSILAASDSGSGIDTPLQKAAEAIRGNLR